MIRMDGMLQRVLFRHRTPLSSKRVKTDRRHALLSGHRSAKPKSKRVDLSGRLFSAVRPKAKERTT